MSDLKRNKIKSGHQALLSDTISRYVKDLHLKCKDNDKGKQLSCNWPKIVGKILADYSRVLHIKNGVLSVHVSNSSALAELSRSRNLIIEKIAKLSPVCGVNKITFKMLGVNEK